VLEAINANANANANSSAEKKRVRTVHRIIVPDLIVRESTCSVK
jgi:hypothetical protein